MISFREFVEQESAPVMGSGSTQPPNPDQGTHDDLRVMSKELDISPEEQAAADMATTFTLYQPLEFKSTLSGKNFKVMPPTEVAFEKINDESYKLKVFAGSGGTNRQKVQDMNGNDYRGELEDLERVIGRGHFEKLKAHSLKAMASGGGMGADPMGGMMGGPPMGGAPPMGMM